MDVEQSGDSNGVEYLGPVTAGSDHPGGQATVPDSPHRLKRRRERGDTLGGEDVEEVAILPVGQTPSRGRIRWIGRCATPDPDAPRRQKRLNPVDPGPTVDMASIIVVAEGLAGGVRWGLSGQVLVEEVFPGGGMDPGGVGDNPVQVEYHRVETVWGDDDLSWFAGHRGVLSSWSAIRTRV